MRQTPPLSASRLNEYLDCRHKAALWLSGVPQSDPGDEAQELIRNKGLDHEARVLADLEARLGPAVKIRTHCSLDERVEQTKAAVLSGAPLIYQAAFSSGRWIGFPDFLVRCQIGSDEFNYQPEDAKLSRRAKAAHVLQLSVYARLVQETFGVPFGHGVVHVQAPAVRRALTARPGMSFLPTTKKMLG